MAHFHVSANRKELQGKKIPVCLLIESDNLEILNKIESLYSQIEDRSFGNEKTEIISLPGFEGLLPDVTYCIAQYLLTMGSLLTLTGAAAKVSAETDCKIEVRPFETIEDFKS